MTVNPLPTFTVHQIDGGRALGSFNDYLWMAEEHCGCLMLPDQRLVSGRFVEVDLKNKTASFLPATPRELAEVRDGGTYHRLDGYWGELAALVMDRQRVWDRRVFEPADAVRFDRDDGYHLGKPTNKAMPPDGTVLKGGWDHEHCDICWATISPHVDPVGWFSKPDHWVCCRCYNNFVVRRSLDFIVGEQPGQPAGEE